MKLKNKEKYHVRGMFGGHDISLYVGKYEKANKILNISGTIS